VAVVPIVIIWFGIGVVPAVLTAFLISFFPIVVDVATGLAAMEPELEDVLRALGARRLDIMLKVGIPRTQPYLFGSLKVAITLALVGRSEEHTSELQSPCNLVCRLLLEKKKKNAIYTLSPRAR